MKFLSICDPTRYKRPPLDVPTFYQKLSQDPRVAFYHLPTPWVSTHAPPQVQAVPLFGSLSYDEFVTAGHRLSDAIHLSNIDLVFCRTLKPFPVGYLNQLAEWEKYTRFVNSPVGKQKQIKSDFLLTIAQPYLPDAIATANASEALAFFEAHQVIVAKRENSCGGRGVFKIWYQEGAFQIDNILTGTGCFAKFSDVMRYLQGGTTQSLQFCRYLTRTQAGDKRVVVVDGEIYGSYLRRSKSGHWVNNVSSDGECVLADITDDERDAIDHTVRHYRALGLHTLGYDFLQDDDGTWRLSEINAGNIGGFARLEQLTGQPVMGRFIDWLRHYAQREKHAQPERSQVLEPRVREGGDMCVVSPGETWPPCQVRLAVASDYGAIASIYNEAIARGNITMDTRPYSAQSIEAVVKKMGEREALLVATCPDLGGEPMGSVTEPATEPVIEPATEKVIGWGIIKRYSDRPGYQVCCETSIYLTFSATGHGYGYTLQTALMEKVSSYGYHHIVAKILADNPGSIRFHQRFGFETVGIQKEIGLINNTWHDVVIMQCLLPPTR